MGTEIGDWASMRTMSESRVGKYRGRFGGSQKNSFVPGLSLDNSNMSMSSVGPQSPLEMKPETGNLINPGNFSPSGPNSPGNLLSTSPSGQNKAVAPYPPNHPLSGSKHLCSICGDRASGKHYGVYSSHEESPPKNPKKTKQASRPGSSNRPTTIDSAPETVTRQNSLVHP
ncbi:Protein ultraspiracle like protein [Eufriesea mexicana]|uniref:Protein ultraspiracle like protein n=1 Tax=Eufriesea mexicana TaxID=516756 RepID=A0A310SDU3_9HYME|nr:Protein ultraspiracle like protein [Eufriesea mexicana]